MSCSMSKSFRICRNLAPNGRSGSGSAAQFFHSHSFQFFKIPLQPCVSLDGARKAAQFFYSHSGSVFFPDSSLYCHVRILRLHCPQSPTVWIQPYNFPYQG